MEDAGKVDDSEYNAAVSFSYKVGLKRLVDSERQLYFLWVCYKQQINPVLLVLGVILKFDTAFVVV